MTTTPTTITAIKKAGSDTPVPQSKGRSTTRLRAAQAKSTRSPAGRWYGPEDIAEDLGVSLSTVRKWCARGEPYFPRSIRLPNGRVRVQEDWYEEWLASLEVA